MTRLVQGVGVNDAPYTVKGDGFICPFYRTWSDMMQRGYSEAFKRTNPTYKDVTVCEEWHKFSSFKAWMESQKWAGMVLDKDLKVFKSKIYSPETCTFIPPIVNCLLLDCQASRGEHPLGVDYLKSHGKYRARVSIAGTKYFTGTGYLKLHDTAKEAHRAWQRGKVDVIENVLTHTHDLDKDVRESLLGLINQLLLAWTAGVEFKL